MPRIAFVLIAATLLAVPACNTTKTDSRSQDSPEVTDEKTGASTPDASAPGTGVLAGPTVGSITSVATAAAGIAPDFAWSDARGEHKLSDYRGRVVMINFWGTWCPPCRRELPALVKIREDLTPAKFEIIGINIGERPTSAQTVHEKVEAFASENNIRYPLVIGDENLVNAYGGIEVVPTTIIVDGAGKIVERIQGSRDEAGFRSAIDKAM